MKDDDEHPERPVFSQTIAKGAIRKHSESILTELIKQCDGTLGSFSEFTYGDKRQTRKIPWNCDLEIGKNFVIKTASYVYVSERGCLLNTICISDHKIGRSIHLLAAR